MPYLNSSGEDALKPVEINPLYKEMRSQNKQLPRSLASGAVEIFMQNKRKIK